jgi:hypothetical protein
MQLFDATVRSARNILLAMILSSFIKMEGLQEVFSHVAAASESDETRRPGL